MNNLQLTPAISTKELVEFLEKQNIPTQLKSLIKSAFRIRVKYKEGYNQNQLQIRLKPTSIDELDLEEYRLELQQLLIPNGIEYVVLEYLDCCMKGCEKCQNFESLMC